MRIAYRWARPLPGMRRRTPTGGTDDATRDASNDPTHYRPGAVELPPWERAELLSSRRRRATLGALDGRTPPVTLSDLAADVATREDGERADVDGDDRADVGGRRGGIEREVAIALHHVHLPRLADGGVIDYDPELNLVESFDPRVVAP